MADHDADEPTAPQAATPVEPGEAAGPEVAGGEPEAAPPAEPESEPSVDAPAEPAVTLAEPPRVQADVVPPSVQRRTGWGARLRRIAAIVALVIVLGPPLAVVVFRFVPPPVTELMLQRLVEGYGLDYQWRPLSQISPAMTQAAVASEDARFCTHHGFDFEAMRAAMAHNERRPNKLKGGSTISQQTAKNVFLWPGRSYLRKGIEAWYTVLIEALWGKRRIMEVYLNVVEFGQGVYGAQAAAQHFFHEDAADLTPDQAAHLIAVLPDPLKWPAVAPGHYVAKRSGRIDRAIGTVRDDGLAGCVGR